MEQMLLKMARWLNAMDEASLMNLWDKYVQRVKEFDASKEWEEAAIILTLIQAPTLKNRLFNTRWMESHALQVKHIPGVDSPLRRLVSRPPRRNRQTPEPKTAKILPFRPRKKTQPL